MKDINIKKSPEIFSSFYDKNHTNKGNILIVEDETIIALDLQRQLEVLGYTVPSIVSSGEDAVIKAQECNPDIVLMDIMLSGTIDGIEAADRIRSRNNIPVIYLTAYAGEKTLERAKLTEPYGYLIKPVGNKELQTTIEITLVKHREEKRLEAAISKAMEEEAKTKAIISAIGDGVVIQDTDYKILYQNEIQKEIHGDRIGEYCYKVYADRDSVCEGCPVELSFQDGKIHKDLRSVTTDKGTVYYELTSSPLEDSSGRIIAGIKVIRNITEQKNAEEVLQNKGRQLAESQRVARLGSWEWDIVNNRITCSDELYRIFGLQPDEFEATYESLLNMVHPDDRAHIDKAVQESLREKKSFHNDARIIRPDGSELIMEIRGELTLDRSGNPIIIGGTAQDITERKRLENKLLMHRNRLSQLVNDKTFELTSAIELLKDEINERRKNEEALRQSERRYRGLFNYMSSGVAVYEAVENGKNFIFKDFNKSGERIDKIKKEELLGKKVTDIFPGIRKMGLLKVFQSVWKTGNPEHIYMSQYKDQRISGWRENYVYKLPSGEIIAIYNDITEQVKSAERESDLLIELKTIFENFPVGIVYLDSNYRIISSNKFFNDFTGFREEQLTGKICYEVVGEYTDDPTKNGREKICSFCKKDECIKLKSPTVMERPLGEKFVRVSTIPELDENGNISRFMEIVEDITERKLAEAEVVRASHLAALGELAAGVAHEINNPINGIINYTQILANKSKKDSDEHEIANRIIKESDRIANIVHNLLSFARDRKEEKIPANIHDILNETLALTETQIKKDGIILIMNVLSSLPAIIAHPQQLEQVFLNIISNARYALNQKYPGFHEDKILEVYCKKTTIRKSPYIRITFYDHGTGISAGIINKIMNPFFTTKSNTKGTGLGLSISHGIIGDHGGKLLVNSIEGEFTKIIIELPVRN